jgi:hypothetical protein
MTQEVVMPVGYASFNTPNGANIAPQLNGPNIEAPFANTAVFNGAPIGNGEYRQSIKGSYVVNGAPLVHYLCPPTQISTAVYQEDGCPNNGSNQSCSAYGYRNCPQNPKDQYLPNRATGPNFSMQDEPGFRNVVAGSTYVLTLSFQGRLIDTSTNNVLVSQTWTTNGTTIVPANISSAKSVGLAASDKVIQVHIAYNLDSNAAELHVVISRRGGQPPLDPQSVSVTLIDSAGTRKALAGTPAVHEVGNKARTTVSIVYPIDAGTSAPVTVEVTAHGRTLTMPVKTAP